MIRRLFCFFCAALILCMSFPAATFAAKAAPVVCCYDFDLAFSLNVDAFSLQDREKLSGYADLLGSLGLKGRIAWCPKRKSMDLDATLYYIDKPSLSTTTASSSTPSARRAARPRASTASCSCRRDGGMGNRERGTGNQTNLERNGNGMV